MSVSDTTVRMVKALPDGVQYSRTFCNYARNETVYHDDAASGRDYSEKDALYLDGKRLVQKYGDGIVNGATFVSETDPYSVFTICGSGPEMWICGKLSNGNTVWYGRDIDARQFTTTL